VDRVGVVEAVVERLEEVVNSLSTVSDRSQTHPTLAYTLTSSLSFS
jgi:hypothetical protein